MLSPCVDNGPPVVWPVENKSPAYCYAFETPSAALAPSNSSLAESDENTVNRSDVDRGTPLKTRHRTFQHFSHYVVLPAVFFNLRQVYFQIRSKRSAFRLTYLCDKQNWDRSSVPRFGVWCIRRAHGWALSPVLCSILVKRLLLWTKLKTSVSAWWREI